MKPSTKFIRDFTPLAIQRVDFTGNVLVESIEKIIEWMDKHCTLKKPKRSKP